MLDLRECPVGSGEPEPPGTFIRGLVGKKSPISSKLFLLRERGRSAQPAQLTSAFGFGGSSAWGVVVGKKFPNWSKLFVLRLW